MRLTTTYLTIALVGLALGRNIENEQAKGNNEAPLLSGAKTLESNPMTYRNNQMRMHLLDSKQASNTGNNLKPIEATNKQENVVPSADANKLKIVEQPKLDAKIAKEDVAVDVKKPELNEIKQQQSSNDKINAMTDSKKTLNIPNSNVKAAVAEAKTEDQIAKVAKVVQAISNPEEPIEANENGNLDVVPLELQEAVLKDTVKDDDAASEKSYSKENTVKEKVEKKTESKSQKKSETKNKEDKHANKIKSEDEQKKKEIKNSLTSPEEKGDLTITDADPQNTLSKISKEVDSHKNKDKSHVKKQKKVKDDDDSEDEDSSDEDDD